MKKKRKSTYNDKSKSMRVKAIANKKKLSIAVWQGGISDG